jgi:rubredoxin
MNKYGLLDPRPLGQEEKHSLKCEMCGLEFSNQDHHEEDEEPGGDYENINDLGRCIECQDEWGSSWADR